MRPKLKSAILYVAADLGGVTIRIDIGADARDLAPENLVGKGGGYSLQLLADAYPREINFVNIRGQPYVVQRTELI
jgi:hypothetical protein